MSGSRGQPKFRSYRAPREDRGVLIDPPPGEIGRVLAENRRLRGQYEYQVQRRSLAEVADQARRELFAAARQWTTAYRDVHAPAPPEAELVFLAGHQPQLFHPGVWLKNYMLGCLARQYGATPVNLIVDSDTVRTVEIRVPGGTLRKPRFETVALDRPAAPVAYEERPIADRDCFHSFGRRVAERIRPLVPEALIDTFWPLVVEQSQRTDNLGACLAQARHRLEAQWGWQTWEVPQSRVCDSESFCWFAAHLLAELPRLWGAYNEAVRQYRRAHRIRNAAQPVPDLAAEGPWLESPLWIWSTGGPRRRLFARQQGREVVLSDREGWETSLPLQPGGDASPAVDHLLQLRRRGTKIRSRALITTLWARLVLGDLFVHGIGGAKYDEVTDTLIERFFALRPPRYLVISATLHLPIERPPQPPGEMRTIDDQLRRLTYHPEGFLDGIDRSDIGCSDEASRLAAEKARWIHTPPTPQNARMRCRAIRQINAALQPWLAPQRQRLLRQQAETRRAVQAEAVLAWREYAFCLYPEKTLREFFAGLLPKSA